MSDANSSSGLAVHEAWHCSGQSDVSLAKRSIYSEPTSRIEICHLPDLIQAEALVIDCFNCGTEEEYRSAEESFRHIAARLAVHDFHAVRGLAGSTGYPRRICVPIGVQV